MPRDTPVVRCDADLTLMFERQRAQLRYLPFIKHLMQHRVAIDAKAAQ